LEQFTSPIGKSDLSKIKKMTKGEFRPAKRWLVEDGNEILKNAKRKKVVLLSYGDPYIATTHIELRTRAIEEKIKTKSIHASSSLTSMIGECGLHFYKVGRIATIMSEMKSLTTPYYVIYKNIIEGNHTVLLLEYNQDKDFFLDPKDALQGLVETEKGLRHICSCCLKDWFCRPINCVRKNFQSQKIGLWQATPHHNYYRQASLYRIRFSENPRRVS
jgi:diphthine synthase